MGCPRVDADRPRVARLHTLPQVAPRVAIIVRAEQPHNALVERLAVVEAATSRGHVQHLRALWVPPHDVAVRIAVWRGPCPGFALIPGAQQAANLDAHVDARGIGRVDQDGPRPSPIRVARQAPALRARHLTGERDLVPRRAAVAAAEQPRRTRAGVYQMLVLRSWRHDPDHLPVEADSFPGAAPAPRPVHSVAGPCEQTPVRPTQRANAAPAEALRRRRRSPAVRDEYTLACADQYAHGRTPSGARRSA